jgi:uncharacterized protein (TIGR03067 family)
LAEFHVAQRLLRLSWWFGGENSTTFLIACRGSMALVEGLEEYNANPTFATARSQPLIRNSSAERRRRCGGAETPSGHLATRGARIQRRESGQRRIRRFGGKWVISERKISVEYKKDVEPRTWSFKFDPEAKPKTIDLTSADGGDKGQVFPGIYELDGDRLRVCYGSPKEKRPTRFGTKKDDGYICLVFERTRK